MRRPGRGGEGSSSGGPGPILHPADVRPGRSASPSPGVVFLVLTLSTVSLALQAAAVVVALAIARAPGWSRVRIVAGLAGTAGLYSLFDLLGVLYPRELQAYSWVTSANLTVAAAHVGIWLWFSFSDERGSWESVPRIWRWTAFAHVAFAAGLAVTGNAIDPSRIDRVVVPWLGVDFGQPQLTALGSVSAVLSIGVLGVSFVQQVRLARRGVPGARQVAIGFVVFVGCGVEEVLVSTGLLDFIFLAEVGFLGIVIPVVAQLVQRFIGDAHRLQALNQALGAEVQVATEERDEAREALAAQTRFAALGRMANALGHEINNPLQVLTLHLEALREAPLKEEAPEAREALEQSVAAAERIARVVAAMRIYASSTPARFEPLDPASVVHEALERTREALARVARVRAELPATPAVLADRVRLVHALEQALANAVRGVDGVAPGASEIVVRTSRAPNGDVAIEVHDNGRGYPASLLPHLGEPFVTSHAESGAAGLGIFVIRGVVDAHGGVLELRNRPEGGAQLRIVLPSAPNG